MYYIHSESNSVLGYFTTGLENILDFGNQPSQTSLGFNRNTILLLLLFYILFIEIFINNMEEWQMESVFVFTLKQV